MFSASFMNWYYSKRLWSVSIRYRLGVPSLSAYSLFATFLRSFLCVHLTLIFSLGIIYAPRGKGRFYAFVPENEVHEDNTLCPRFFANHPPTLLRLTGYYLKP